MAVATSITRKVELDSDLLHNALMVLAGAGILALAGQLKFLLPFTPVPVTAQTLAVVLVAGVLGSMRGTLSVLGFLAAGLAGAPVFAAGGGPAYLFGPTGGYLLGFMPAAWLTGALASNFRASAGLTRALGMLAAVALGDAVIFAAGLAWLGVYKPLAGSILAAGLLPFLPGEAVKLAFATLALTRLRR